MTSITYSDILCDPEVWQGHSLGGALLVKDLATVTAVVLAVREAERSPAAETDFRVDPLRCRLSVHHRRISYGQVLRWEYKTYAKFSIWHGSDEQLHSPSAFKFL